MSLAEPPELLVLDREQSCPYLPGQRARLPLRLPLRQLSGAELDARLAAGDRRWGRLLYRTSCEHCRACEPIRIDVSRFELSRSLRRVLNRGRAELRVELGEPLADEERLALYDKHRTDRQLGEERSTAPEELSRFLVESCCQSFEIRLRREGRLVAVALTDRGLEALNAVYCYFDPELARLSLGTFAILTQLDLCKAWRLRYVYLGLYIAANRHMSYKARFRPHQRLLGGRWRWFDGEATVSLPPEQETTHG